MRRKIFISGTGTDVGKTVISAWIALHTGAKYFKPLQTGAKYGTDSEEVRKISRAFVHHEAFRFQEPLSPHIAAQIENCEINFDEINIPQHDNQGNDLVNTNDMIIIEGAGGLLVPINSRFLVIDLIKKFDTPVILVSHSGLGTINHTLLSIEALRSRNINILGVIMNGCNDERKIDIENNKRSIEFYGNVKVLKKFPQIDIIEYKSLKNIPLEEELEKILMNL